MDKLQIYRNRKRVPGITRCRISDFLARRFGIVVPPERVHSYSYGRHQKAAGACSWALDSMKCDLVCFQTMGEVLKYKHTAEIVYNRDCWQWELYVDSHIKLEN